MIFEALALGFSTGTYCSMYCGPVILPVLFGAEETGCRRNAGLTGAFLAARLAMYFILGFALSAAGLLAGEFFDPEFARRLSSVAYILCGIMLLFNWRHRCNSRCIVIKKAGNDFSAAVFCGLSVGLHICPPLWTAMIRSVAERNFIYMVLFYLGSIPFFLPLLGIPFLTKRVAVLKNVARIAQALTGAYFIFFMGVIPLIFGYGI